MHYNILHYITMHLKLSNQFDHKKYLQGGPPDGQRFASSSTPLSSLPFFSLLGIKVNFGRILWTYYRGDCVVIPNGHRDL